MAIQADAMIGALHSSLAEQVAQRIRGQIADGSLRPDTRLVEQDLADSLGVSRVPVREALRRLETEGFVTRLPRRGVVVASMTRTDVEDLFDVREALEVQAVRLATRRATPEEVAELGAVVARGRDALERGDLTEVAAMNGLFHDLVVQMAHNRVLSSMMEPLHGRLQWILRQNDDPDLVCREHEELQRAIADGKVRHAATCATEHVRTSRALALSLLFRGDGETPAG